MLHSQVNKFNPLVNILFSNTAQDIFAKLGTYLLHALLTLPYLYASYIRTACSEGNIRLGNYTSGIDDDGSFYQQGRVEVCMDGVYGAICDIGWDDLDAEVICRSMGYNTPFYGKP